VFRFSQVLVRRGGALERLSKVGRRTERGPALDAAREPLGDLLQDPAVAVRITERDEGPVRAALRMGAGNGLVVAREPACVAGLAVEDLTGINTAGDEVPARRFDVGDDQVRALGRAQVRPG
jgi:hypothetical protein